MASIIRIKRSTGTLAPSTLKYGELGYTSSAGIGSQSNFGDRLFIGNLSENPIVIGGQYFMDMLDHQHGVLTADSAAIVDSNSKINQWNVDNLRLDDNTLSSTNNDGNILLDPNGTGDIIFTGGVNQDFKITNGSTDRVVVDTNTGSFAITQGSLSSNKPVIDASSTWNNAGTVFYGIKYDLENNTASDPNSKLLDLRVGGVTKFNVDPSGIGTISSDFYVGRDLYVNEDLRVYGDTSLGNSSTDRIDITGQTTITGVTTFSGVTEIDNIRFDGNIISTKSGTGDTLYIDPYPDGLSNEGTVVVKGNLQVDGTTTSVNSTEVTINDAILTLGEVTSVRTVMQPVLSGVSNITLDSVTGINTGDIIQGSASLPNSGITTITAFDVNTKIITIQGTTGGTISSTTQLTVTHAYDTNTDRGIAFNYNTSTGTSNNKIGFFGYIDGTNPNSNSPIRSWTYIPDSTISNSVVTGTRGFLDIKGIYYQNGDYSTHGIVYFDVNGLQRSTDSPSSPTITSTQLLTAVTEIVLTLDGNYNFASGDQITQSSNSGAYGVVKTTVTDNNIVTLIGVQGTFDTTNAIINNGTVTSRIPSSISTTYSNKPTWTTTLDGGTF